DDGQAKRSEPGAGHRAGREKGQLPRCRAVGEFILPHFHPGDVAKHPRRPNLLPFYALLRQRHEGPGRPVKTRHPLRRHRRNLLSPLRRDGVGRLSAALSAFKKLKTVCLTRQSAEVSATPLASWQGWEPF